MENQIQKQQPTVKSLLDNPNVRAKFENILKSKASGFVANLAVMVNNSETLKKCDPQSVVAAAIIGAALDLPLDPNFGYAAIIPYKDKATFQVMTKGFIQLAQRTGQFKRLTYTTVHEGDTDEDVYKRLTAKVLQQKPATPAIGYASYMQLTNGFEASMYMDKREIDAHAKRYSQSYRGGYGLWKDDFDVMAVKTIIKLLLKRYAPLSIELNNAVKYDQGVVKDVETGEVEYVDGEEERIEAANPLKKDSEKPLTEVFK